jgi:hypothetical protein
VTTRYKAWVYGRSLAGICGFEFRRGYLSFVLCVIIYCSLRRANHSSSAVLPNVCVSNRVSSSRRPRPTRAVELWQGERKESGVQLDKVALFSRRMDAFSSECSTQLLVHFLLHSGYGLAYRKLYTKVWRNWRQCYRTVRRRVLNNTSLYVEVPHVFFIKCIDY